MNGHIKWHRKITDWEWYKSPNMVHLFSHLLIMANYKENKLRGREIKRGQLITTRRQLGADTGLSDRQIRTCMDKLISTNEISIEPTTRDTKITIHNYNSYQSIITTDNEEKDHPHQQKTNHIANERPTISPTNDQPYRQQTTNHIASERPTKSHPNDLLNHTPTTNTATNAETSNEQRSKEEKNIIDKGGVSGGKIIPLPLKPSFEFLKDQSEKNIIDEMWKTWMEYNPKYQNDKENDSPALLKLAFRIAKMEGWRNEEVLNGKLKGCAEKWLEVVKFIRQDDFFKKLGIKQIESQWPNLCQTMDAEKEGKTVKRKTIFTSTPQDNSVYDYDLQKQKDKQK